MEKRRTETLTIVFQVVDSDGNDRRFPRGLLRHPSLDLCESQLPSDQIQVWLSVSRPLVDRLFFLPSSCRQNVFEGSSWSELPESPLLTTSLTVSSWSKIGNKASTALVAAFFQCRRGRRHFFKKFYSQCSYRFPSHLALRSATRPYT